MSQLTLATLSAILILIALIAYAILGGADFGGGLWDALARGPAAAQERAAIARAMGPVWESNNVWLVFVLVVTWTAFPVVYAGISTALFIPITLALIGIVLRGAAFSFRSNYGMEVGTGLAWGHVFSGASIITPFLLGTVAGALASGGIHVSSGLPLQVQANPWTTWTTPFALSCGALAVGICSVLSATYLTVETWNTGEPILAQHFRLRALVAGAVTALFGAIAAGLARVEAPTLWHGLIGRALPFSLGAVLIGLATAAALLRNLYRTARFLVAAETACILIAWGVAQWPYLIVPDVTINNAASPASILGPMLIVSLLGLVILLPALWYLFSVFKRQRTASGSAAGMNPATSITTAAFVASLPSASADLPLNETRTPDVRLQSSASLGGRVLERIVPMLAFLVALAVALLVTVVSEQVRSRS